MEKPKACSMLGNEMGNDWVSMTLAKPKAKHWAWRLLGFAKAFECLAIWRENDWDAMNWEPWMVTWKAQMSVGSKKDDLLTEKMKVTHSDVTSLGFERASRN